MVIPTVIRVLERSSSVMWCRWKFTSSVTFIFLIKLIFMIKLNYRSCSTHLPTSASVTMTTADPDVDQTDQLIAWISHRANCKHVQTEQLPALTGSDIRDKNRLPSVIKVSSSSPWTAGLLTFSGCKQSRHVLLSSSTLWNPCCLQGPLDLCVSLWTRQSSESGWAKTKP